MAIKQVKLVDGPGKWDVMLSLFDPGRPPLEFESANGLVFAVSQREFREEDAFYTHRIHLWSLTRDDESGDSWSFSGIVIVTRIDSTGKVNALFGRDFWVRVSGHFNTRTRRGEMTVDDELSH